MSPFFVVLASPSPLDVVLAPGVASAYRPFDGTDGDVAAPGELEIERAAPLRPGGTETFFFSPGVGLAWSVLCERAW
jgi:hypothetical protein